MANPFLNKTDLMDRDIETALMLERAIIHDIGNAVAYTDGIQVYVNTEDNLYKILPAYDHRMLKWLLWHERYHMELRHHNRFFKYLHELEDADALKEFHVTKEEINIIMDILVHDSLSKLFPDLVEVAVNNLAQMRNRNSLSYTFKTNTLEEMLDEYKAFKKDSKEEDKDGKDGEGKGEGEKKESTDKEGEGKEKGKPDGDSKGESKEKGHKEGGKSDSKSKDKPEDGEPEIKDESERPAPGSDPLPDEHDKTDWSKLKDIDSREFITEDESRAIQSAVTELKRKKLRLAKLTETLNGLVTSTRRRTYSKPNPIKVGGGIVLKGSTPGRAELYLVFDASGSMGSQMETFKEIISKSIPQAMEVTCEWFAGCTMRGKTEVKPTKKDGCDYYYKAKFKDFMNVYATGGYDDDGDRTIELCWLAEKAGLTPIGVTDGGGQISWSKDKLKQLKRTILVGQNPHWLKKAREINPRIQTLDI